MAMWLTFNKMADDVPSETRTNQVEQARIHSCFHRFTKIGQIFGNIYIFNEKNFPSFKASS